MTHKPDYTMRVNGAVIKQYRFDNGYGASVHKAPGEFFWQVGVTGEGDNLIESSPVFTGALKTGLIKNQVEWLLDEIERLEPRNA